LLPPSHTILASCPSWPAFVAAVLRDKELTELVQENERLQALERESNRVEARQDAEESGEEYIYAHG